MTIISIIKVPFWVKLKRDAQLVFCTRGTAGVEVGYEHAAVAHKLIPPCTTVTLVFFKNGVKSGGGRCGSAGRRFGTELVSTRTAVGKQRGADVVFTFTFPLPNPATAAVVGCTCVGGSGGFNVGHSGGGGAGAVAFIQDLQPLGIDQVRLGRILFWNTVNHVRQPPVCSSWFIFVSTVTFPI